MADCDICVESFNKSTRKKINCSSCNNSFCIKCFENYLMNSNNDYDCMHCHKIYDSDFMIKNVTKAMIGRLKKHRENILFDREKAKLPETMENHFEYDKYIEKLKSNIIDLKNELTSVNEEIKFICSDNDYIYDDEAKDDVKDLTKKKNELNDKLYRLRFIVGRWKVYYKVDNKQKKDKETVIKVAHQCPVDDCNGFVYTNGKCGVCETTICRKCRCVKEEDHECDENLVETVNTLKKDSKPCPKCAAMIFKISGCDQMWCVQCKTPFSWKTGEVVTSNIHNPHYFQWLAKNRNISVNDDGNLNQCGGRIAFWQLSNHIRLVCDHNNINKIYDYYRLSTHVEEVEIRALNDNQNEEHKNLDLRLKWLHNNIDEKRMKQELYKRERANNFKHLKSQVFHMLVTVFNDLFHRILHINDNQNITKIFEEFNKVINYANDSLKELTNLYKLKTKRFYQKLIHTYHGS
jgi:hypothetical protein